MLAPARVDLGEGNTAPNVAIVQFVIGRCFNSLPDGNLLLKGLGAVARLGEGEKLCSWLVFITNAQQSPGRTIDFCYPHLHCFQRAFQIILQMPFHASHSPPTGCQTGVATSSSSAGRPKASEDLGGGWHL